MFLLNDSIDIEKNKIFYFLAFNMSYNSLFDEKSLKKKLQN